MADDLRKAYESRLSMLSHVANALEQETRDYLSGFLSTHQVRFRLLETDDFLEKAERGRLADPLVEIEDQIVGHVTVRPDAPPAVEQRLQDAFSAVEGNWQDATDDERTGYPTRRLVCVIPPQVKPPGWDARGDVPKTFELRVCVDTTLPARSTDSVDVIKTTTEGRVLFGLHGIRTHADWYSNLAQLGQEDGWQVRTARWRFGYFSVFQFLLPLARRTKVTWFQNTYREETHDKAVKLAEGQRPSIIAHSFGTYILGNALLKHDSLKFNKVILCGSILPQDFPWDKLLERGQVQAVRNEFGVKDIWTGLVRWFVAGTGPSGRRGFHCGHDRFEQERFLFEHSEYFFEGHMEARWIPFLDRELPWSSDSTVAIDVPKASRPWVTYALYMLLVASILCLAKHFLFGGSPEDDAANNSNSATTVNNEAGGGYDTPLAPGEYPSVDEIPDLPSKEAVSREPQVSPQRVVFKYRNTTGVRMKLLVLDCHYYHYPHTEPLAPKGAWRTWDLPATGQWKSTSEFKESTGWFVFYVQRLDNHERHRLCTKNIFYSDRPTMTVCSTSDKANPFTATFSSEE